MSKYKDYTPSPVGLTQKQLFRDVADPTRIYKVTSATQRIVLDQGYAVNGEYKVSFSPTDVLPYSKRVEFVNAWAFKAWNAYFMETEEHYMQLVFADLGFACAGSLHILEKENLEARVKHEWTGCTAFDKQKFSSKSHYDSAAVSYSFDLYPDIKSYDVRFRARGSFPAELKLFFNNSDSDSNVWLSPLTDDNSTYYIA